MYLDIVNSSHHPGTNPKSQTSNRANLQLSLKTALSSWRDSSVVRSTQWSCREPEFSSQHPDGGLQPNSNKSDGIYGKMKQSIKALP